MVSYLYRNEINKIKMVKKRIKLTKLKSKDEINKIGRINELNMSLRLINQQEPLIL